MCLYIFAIHACVKNMLMFKDKASNIGFCLKFERI